jgi:hypothetical protein
VGIFCGDFKDDLESLRLMRRLASICWACNSLPNVGEALEKCIWMPLPSVLLSRDGEMDKSIRHGPPKHCTYLYCRQWAKF